MRKNSNAGGNPRQRHGRSRRGIAKTSSSYQPKASAMRYTAKAPWFRLVGTEGQ